MTWRDRAACLDEDPELFFPIGTGPPAFRQIEKAKVVCFRCEVMETCLSWAMESGKDDGVWGAGSDIEGNTLDAFVRLLRAKVEETGQARLIQTVRGVGYRLDSGVALST